LCGWDGSRPGVDLVGIDIFIESFGDGLIKPGQQLREGSSLAAAEHGQAVVAVGGNGDAADLDTFRLWWDFSLGDQIRDVRQGQNDLLFSTVRRLWGNVNAGYRTLCPPSRHGHHLTMSKL